MDSYIASPARYDEAAERGETLVTDSCNLNGLD